MASSVRMETRKVAVLLTIVALAIGALLPFGGGEAPRISLVTSTAARSGGSLAVDVSLQLQSGGEPSEFRALLLALNVSPNIARIAFYFDSAYPILGPLERIHGLIDHLRPALKERHYAGELEIVDAEGLRGILVSSNRTVVVMATTVFPDTVLNHTVNLVTPWLGAGGILLWTGGLIGAYIGHRGQSAITWNDTANLRWDGEKQIFGSPVIGNLSGPPADPVARSPTATSLDLRYPIAETGANLTLVQNRSWLPLGSIYGAPYAVSSISWIPVGSGGVVLFGSGPQMPFGYSAEDVVANDIAQALMAGVPWWNLTLSPLSSTVVLTKSETRAISLHFVLPGTVQFARLFVYSTGPLRPAVLSDDFDFRTI